MPLFGGLELAWSSIVFYIIIMGCLIYMSLGFRVAIRRGQNGINLGLMFVFAALANEHLYFSIASTLLLFPEFYSYYQLAIWIWRNLSQLLVIWAFVELFREFRRARVKSI